MESYLNLKNCIYCIYCDTETIIIGKPTNNIKNCGSLKFKYFCIFNKIEITPNNYLNICNKYKKDIKFIKYIFGDVNE